MATMIKSISLLALIGFPALASAKTLSLPISGPQKRNIHTRSRLARRSGSHAVTLGNDVQDGLYYVNASVGTPAQTVQLQIDTGSSDTWMFDPTACSEVQCLGYSCKLCELSCFPSLSSVIKQSPIHMLISPSVNPQKSSTYTTLEQGGFEIQYGTAGSLVKGDYFSDNFGIGDMVVKNLTMALATEAENVPTGIMGISFPQDESITETGTQPYPNLVSVMYTQGLIGARAYSLYLDDLEAATGNILFGGYDTDKYTGDLLTLAIQPDAQTGTISTMTVALTSLGIEDSSGSQSLTNSSFAEAALLDSGTTLTLLPPAIFESLSTYFNAQYDSQEGVALVECTTVQNAKGTVNFGFGGSGGPVIKVPYSEFAVPIYTSTGQPATFNNGATACMFGILDQNQASLGIILGDTFLRSAYVVYDLDNKQIALAQSSFNSQSSNVKDIGSGTPGTSVAGGGVTVVQSASEGLAPGVQTGSAGLSSVAGAVTLTGSGIVAATGSTTATSGSSSGASSSKSAANIARPDGSGFSFFSFSMCVVSLLTGLAFIAFR